MTEWHLADILITCHDHTCHPEEDNIWTCHEVSGWIVVVDFLIAWILDAVEEADRPEPRRKPCIKCTFVLYQSIYAQARFLGSSLDGRSYDDLILWIVLGISLCEKCFLVEGRNTVSPPELA